MLRAHKIRLNPTPEQQAYFRKAAGTARFVYNWGLAEVKRALDDGRTPDSTLDLKARFNAIKGELFPWVYAVTKCVVEGAFRNLGAALANFRASKRGARKGKPMGFPKFKRKKRGAGSFYLANDKFALDGHWIRIPKLGQVNMTEPLRLAGKIMGATISERAGWWWVSIQVEVPREPRLHHGHALGVDVGVKDLAVDSDGERFENQKPLRTATGRVKRLQRRVSRRIKGSKNRGKALDKLARAHYRVAYLRADAQHKATSRIARKAALIGLEDLNVAGMLRNRRLAQALSDASLSELHRQLRYKAEWYGGQVITIGRFFPSSKRHNGCGGSKDDLELADRVWTCPACGQVVDRDLNAARNIRDQALKLSAVPGVATSAR
ncbi:MAG TPA: RNA-guided endonuclease TnpB family protein [Roseiflexaceae bacterium]|nr:RNA-guided endonuclease TnpB family protein [Roseiflexaceae bacterium]